MKMEGKRKILKLLAVLGVAGIGLVGAKVYSTANANPDVICQGIYIGNIDVGGKTVKEAKKKLEKYVKEAKSEKVTVAIDEEQVTTTLEDLGYRCDIDQFVDKAYNYGKTGDIIKRYKDRKDVEQKNVVYDLAFELDSDKVKKFVEEECTVFDVPAKDATLKRKKGQFVIEKESNGRVIVVDETAGKIEKTISSQWVAGGIEIKAIMNDTTPKYDAALLEECTEVLGSYSTSFASSGSSRSQNLVNAARLIDGTVVYPGETFSTAEKLVPFTVENGYEVAQAYSSGQVIDSVGGGVCQAATTLYNALLRAEIEIVERYNHSMIVGYVKPSMDAAISEGYKDLKFKNNTDTPIYVEAYTANRSIYFNIYGKETRDLENRRVEYESEVLETIQPGEDKVTIDSTKPEGYMTVTQSAHVGYKAQLWKIVYENGKEVSREKVNYSYYAPEPRYVTKGGTADKPEESKNPEETKNPKETQKPGATNKPEKTTKPEPTKKQTVTPKPVATKKPAATQKPIVTKKPVATKAPVKTKVPASDHEDESEDGTVG